MSYQQLQKDALQARKDRDSQKAALLTTVLAQVKTRAIDDGHREVNDDDVLAVARQFIKSANENISLAQKSSNPAVAEKIKDFQYEKETLESYLPQQMSEEELRKAISDLDASHIGEVMKGLQAKYNGRYDGKLASRLAKEILNS